MPTDVLARPNTAADMARFVASFSLAAVFKQRASRGRECADVLECWTESWIRMRENSSCILPGLDLSLAHQIFLLASASFLLTMLLGRCRCQPQFCESTTFVMSHGGANMICQTRGVGEASLAAQ
jgi:hypothetical protein